MRSGVLLPGLELLVDLLLVLVEVAGLGAHLVHLLGELVGGLLAELLADVVQLLAGAGALGDRLGQPALLERLRGLAEVLAALFDLLARLGHPLLVLLLLHALAQLVGVAEDLPLLVAEPFELPLDLGAGLGRLGRLEGRLELLEPLVEVPLALGQLAEAVEDLPVLGLLALALGLVLLRTGGALLLESVLVGGQLELLELPTADWCTRAAAAAALPRCCGRSGSRGRGASGGPGRRVCSAVSAGLQCRDGRFVGGAAEVLLGLASWRSPPARARPSTTASRSRSPS